MGDPGGAFREADVVVKERFRIQRYVGMPMEPRGIIAHYDRRARPDRRYRWGRDGNNAKADAAQERPAFSNGVQAALGQ